MGRRGIQDWLYLCTRQGGACGCDVHAMYDTHVRRRPTLGVAGMLCTCCGPAYMEGLAPAMPANSCTSCASQSVGDMAARRRSRHSTS